MLASRTMVVASPLLLLVVLLAAAAGVAQAGTELSNSVIIVSLHDITPGSGEKQGQRQCEAVIERAARWKSRAISLVVTTHWAGGRKGVDYWTLKDANGGQQQLNGDLLRRWEEGLTACFKAATAAGFTTLHVLPHADDPTGVWRNGLAFDPRRKYGGYSYEDVVLMPAARAVAAAAKPDTSVEFVLAGEMGRSMMGFPQNYINLIGPVKAAINSGSSKPREAKVGVSLNWSRHCSCTGSADLDPLKFNETYAKHFTADKSKLWSQYDVEGFKRLLAASEFIGLSGYGVLPPSNVQPADFQVPIYTLAYELSFWGIDLKGLGKPLVFSEWGLGGSGRTYGGIAQSSSELGRYPVHGKWMNYDSNSDPWLRSDLRQYRQHVYDQLLAWLAGGGGPTYYIQGLYLWSVGTWDVLAVHPITENARGGFGDKDIQSKVLGHNGRVNGLRRRLQ